MDFNNTRHLSRFCTAMDRSYAKLKQLRETRVRTLKQITGAHYGPDGAPKTVPFDLLEMAVNIYTRNLVAQRPAVQVTTKHMELKPGAGRWSWR